MHPEQVAEVDPSEAIRSDEIVPLAMRNFRVIEHRPYGGTTLHMLLHMTAGNFLTDEARYWLELLFELEDLLLPELGSDFYYDLSATRCTRVTFGPPRSALGQARVVALRRSQGPT
jgi:hypothetical protein